MAALALIVALLALALALAACVACGKLSLRLSLVDGVPTTWRARRRLLADLARRAEIPEPHPPTRGSCPVRRPARPIQDAK